MKVEIRAYKYWYQRLGRRNFFPKVAFSKNVQGWFFTRSMTGMWGKWAITFFLNRHSSFEVDRGAAHKQNVKRFMK